MPNTPALSAAVAQPAATTSTLPDPTPGVLVIQLADFSVVLQARHRTPPGSADTLRAQEQGLTAIKEALAQNSVDLPYPTQQMLFHDRTEETNGDRAVRRT